MTDSFSEALREADAIIAEITTHDYSAGREEIANVLDKYLYNGVWDMETNFENDLLPDLRIIQEDEYDQSMDEDEKPDWDSMLAEIRGYYIFPA